MAKTRPTKDSHPRAVLVIGLLWRERNRFEADGNIWSWASWTPILLLAPYPRLKLKSAHFLSMDLELRVVVDANPDANVARPLSTVCVHSPTVEFSQDVAVRKTLSPI